MGALWRRGKALPAVAVALALGLLFAALSPADAPAAEMLLRLAASGLVGAALLLGLQELVTRTHPLVLVPLLALPLALGLVDAARVAAYPGAGWGALAGIAVLATAVWLVAGRAEQ
jgi:hypothetical protein